MVKKIDLNKPPVIEVVIGSQFDGPIFDNSYIYDFYQKVKKDYPVVRENPPLPSIISNLNKPDQTRILQGFNSRRFFISTKGDKLIQLQTDRLLFNWRKNNASEEYPKFTNVLEDFLKIYELLSNDIKTASSKINQLEITFIDHISLKDFELNSYKLSDIFTQFNFSQELRSFDCNLSFPQESINGNLNLSIKTAVNIADQNKIIVCESTCRGNKTSTETHQAWFQKAHAILLECFIDLFTDKSKKTWGVKL
jgi:uncharacterized protein (TIGR04255 family)